MRFSPLPVLSRSSRTNALIAVSLGQFMGVITLLAVSAVLPTIGASLDVELSEAGWIITSFLLGLAAFVLISGRLGDAFGYRRVFALGVVQFTVAGTLAGLSPDIPTLLVARGLQGVGAALMLGTGYAIVSEAYPPHQRARALGVTLAAAPLGGLVGLSLNPLVLEYLNWHWIFIISALPFGLLTLFFTWRMGLQEPFPRRGSARHLDIRGAVLFAGFMAALLLSFSHLHGGEETFQAGWEYHTSMQLVAVLLLALFIWAERRTPAPLIQLNHFRQRVFGSAVVANGILHMTMMTVLFIFPFMVENGLGRSNIDTSIMLILFTLINIPTALASGWLYDRTGSQLIRPVALAVVALGLVAMGVTVSLGSYWLLVAVLMVVGSASGFFITPASTAIMSALPPEHRGFASGMIETSRHVGHSLGAALATAVMGFSVLGTLSEAGAEPGAFMEAFRTTALVVGGIAALGVIPSAIRSRHSTLSLAMSSGPAMAGQEEAPVSR